MSKSDKVFKENSKLNFNNQAEIYYKSGDGIFVTPMYGEIISRILKVNPSNVLDVGCGTGNMLLKLIENNDIELCGLDLSEKMIEMAEKNLKDKADLKVGDSESIPWEDNYFDVVVCNASFHHYPNPQKVLLEMKRVLKGNGTLIIGDPTAPIVIREVLNLTCKFGNSGDYRIYSKKEIEKLLFSCGFEAINFNMINYKSFAINAKIRDINLC